MKPNADIELVFFDLLHFFSKLHFVNSIFTIERSKNKGLLHIQGVFTIVYDLRRCDGYFRDDIKDKLKRILNIGPGYRMSVTKLDVTGQHFMYMLGYVTKDHLQKHYVRRSHNIRDCDIRDGRALFNYIKGSFP